MQKILTLFGLIRQKRYNELAEALRNRVNESNKLKEEVLKLETEKALRSPRPVLRVDEDDPDSGDPAARSAYAARVAGFHHDVLSKKLKRLKAEVRNDIMSIGRDTFGYSNAEFDIYLKGTENALSILEDWGEHMISEHVANGQPDEGDLKDEEVQELKDKLKENV